MTTDAHRVIFAGKADVVIYIGDNDHVQISIIRDGAPAVQQKETKEADDE